MDKIFSLKLLKSLWVLFNNVLKLVMGMLSFFDQNLFQGIRASAADTAAFNPSGIKLLLTNGLSMFFINDKFKFY